MKGRYTETAIGIIAFIVLCFLASEAGLALRVKAQDTAPAWEYGALITEGESAFAFTADLAANNEINKLFDAMDDDEFNVIVALNVMGAEGWEFLETQSAGAGSTLYLLKRPKD